MASHSALHANGLHVLLKHCIDLPVILALELRGAQNRHKILIVDMPALCAIHLDLEVDRLEFFHNHTPDIVHIW